MTNPQDFNANQHHYVVGVAARTTNEAESDPQTAQLPDLWDRALRHPSITQRRRAGEPMAAVLIDYASDHTGPYTQIVGTMTASAESPPEGLVTVFVPAGQRHHEPAHGEIPGALIAAWQRVWQLSESGHLRRSFQTDIEIYSDHGADLYVSTQQAAFPQ